jgi:hypothetical protein
MSSLHIDSCDTHVQYIAKSKLNSHSTSGVLMRIIGTHVLMYMHVQLKTHMQRCEGLLGFRVVQMFGEVDMNRLLSLPLPFTVNIHIF